MNRSDRPEDDQILRPKMGRRGPRDRDPIPPNHVRMARENFMGGDPHDDSPMPLDYFVWGLISESRIIVVDTGFDRAMADKRGRTLLKPLSDGLRAIGIEPAKVEDVLITHMHYDHCGNHELFPVARFHVQDREMQFVTGRSMTHAAMRVPFEENDVVAMVRRVFNNRVVFDVMLMYTTSAVVLTVLIDLHPIGSYIRFTTCAAKLAPSSRISFVRSLSSPADRWRAVFNDARVVISYLPYS